MISHFIQLIIDFIAGHPGLAILIVFAISMGEALFIIGLFIPSTAVLVGAGTLIGMGQLHFLPIYVSATFGAVAGDAISYWIGHVGKQRIKGVWPFSRYRSLLARGESFFERHGAKSIFIGRFIPGVKAVVPGIAGMMGMSAIRFSIINVVSAFIWTAAHLLPGMGLGRGLNVAGSANPRLVAVLAAIVFMAVVAWYLTKLVLGYVLPHLDRARASAIAWLHAEPSPARRLAARVLANEEGILAPLVWAVAGLAATSGLVALTVNALFDPALATSDNAISGFIQNFRTAPADEAMVIVTMLGDRVIMVPLATVFILWLLAVRRPRLAAASLIAFGTAALFAPLARFLLDRAQNTRLFMAADTSSFPSGHATMTTVVFGVIVLILAHNLPARWRTMVYAATVAVIAIIAFSRVYLLVHWPSEVAAGLLFGSTILSIVAFLMHGLDIRIGARWLAATLCVTFVAVFPAHVARDFGRAVHAYAPIVERINMTTAQWLDQGWRALPSARILLDGQNGEPFVMQTDLGAGRVEKALNDAGWRRVQPRRFEALLMSAVPLPLTLDERPILPFYHNGMRTVAELVRNEGADSRIVLRIWKSALMVRTSGGDHPVLLVSLARERLEPSLFGLSDLESRPLNPAELNQTAAAAVSALDRAGTLSPVSPRAGLTLLPAP